MTHPLSAADTAEILELEQEALKRWCAGDPSGFLELSSEDVVYFDPFLPSRLDGRQALTSYYAGLKGKIRADRFELLNPHFHALAGGAVLLTFNFVSYEGDEQARWNATEVYRKDDGKWKIVHSHWSFTRR